MREADAARVAGEQGTGGESFDPTQDGQGRMGLLVEVSNMNNGAGAKSWSIASL
ncbi:MAG: hypothetical protein H8D43_04045 [Chloroflexi bacterium]|nr:hypothetical protein [Chloroflexota bacterium]